MGGGSDDFFPSSSFFAKALEICSDSEEASLNALSHVGGTERDDGMERVGIENEVVVCGIYGRGCVVVGGIYENIPGSRMGGVIIIGEPYALSNPGYCDIWIDPGRN